MLKSAIDLVEAARADLRQAKESMVKTQNSLQELFAKLQVAERQAADLLAENQMLIAKLREAENKNTDLKSQIRTMLEK